MNYWKDVWYEVSLAVLGLIMATGAALLATGGGSSGAVAARATTTAIVTTELTVLPAVTAGRVGEPEVDDVMLDFGRAIDLGTIRDTLTAYRVEFGAFPDSDGLFTTLCVESYDAGCALTAINSEVPFDDGVSPYWYVSDGSTFTLVAAASRPQPNNGACPNALPAALEGDPVMCMSGGRD